MLDDYGGYISIGSSGFVNGVQMIVNNGLYTELTGKSVYEEILPVLKKGCGQKSIRHHAGGAVPPDTGNQLSLL